MKEERWFLNLSERRSQVYLNRATIGIALMAIKVWLFRVSLLASLKVAQLYTFSVCSSIDDSLTQVVSLPHYMARSSNYLIEKGLQEGQTAIIKGLNLAVKGVEELIYFTIELSIGTYVCLLTAAVDGSAEIALNATQSVISAANTTIINLADDIEDGLTGLTKVVNKVISAADKVESFFKGTTNTDEETHKVNLTIQALKKWHIPDTINQKLASIDLPDFQDVENSTKEAIGFPFDKLQQKIANYKVDTKNDSMYVPPLQKVSLCSGNEKLQDFFPSAASDVRRVSLILFILLILSAVLMCAYSWLSEIRQWEKREAAVQDTLSNQVSRTTLLQLVETVSQPLVTKAGQLGSCRFKNATKIRWVLMYGLSPVALTVLQLSAIGIFAVVLQYIMLCVLKSAFRDFKSEIKSIGTDAMSLLDFSVSNWTASTNAFITSKENAINSDVLGWVEEATTSVNTTVVEFMDGMDSKIKTVFEDTPLYKPIKTVVGCVLENKLIKISNGLTWVHDEAKVKFPRVNGTQVFDSTSSDGSLGSAVLTTEKKLSSIFTQLENQYRDSLAIELAISLTLFGLWLLQLLIAGLWCVMKKKVPSISGPMPLNTASREKFMFPQRRSL